MKRVLFLLSVALVSPTAEAAEGPMTDIIEELQTIVERLERLRDGGNRNSGGEREILPIDPPITDPIQGGAISGAVRDIDPTDVCDGEAAALLEDRGGLDAILSRNLTQIAASEQIAVRIDQLRQNGFKPRCFALAREMASSGLTVIEALEIDAVLDAIDACGMPEGADPDASVASAVEGLGSRKATLEAAFREVLEPCQ